MPKVSVIVPVYNVEQYIEKCLENLVNQTLDDIEIIVVNDGSTDNSETIINKYLQKYSNKIKYLTKTNGGLSDSRNYGMKYATVFFYGFVVHFFICCNISIIIRIKKSYIFSCCIFHSIISSI